MSAQAELALLLDAIDALVEASAMPERATLCREALALLDRDADPLRWGILQRELATSLARGPGGTSGSVLAAAIAAYRRALEVLTADAARGPRATTLMNLATALSERADGDRGRNLRDAILLYDEALELLSSDAAPKAWGQAKHNLAAAWLDRPDGDRAAHAKRAIDLLVEALSVRTRQGDPRAWAATQDLLGTAWCERTDTDLALSVERGIEAYERALEARTRETLPTEWANTIANLAGAFLQRFEGMREDNVERAISLYEDALNILTADRHAVRWARAKHNLVTAYRLRAAPADLDRALESGRQALTVRTRSARPAEWAATTVALADAYAARGASSDLGRAATLYRDAHEILREDRDPEEWARVAFSLGLVLAEAGSVTEGARHVRMAMRVYRPGDRRHVRALSKLGDFAFAERDWSKATEAYREARGAGDRLFAASESHAGRRREVSETWQLYARASYAMLQLGREPDALLTLDRGKARLLADALGTGHEADLPLDRLLEVVPMGGALVALLATPLGGAAFVVPAGRDSPHADDVLWLDGLTDRAVVELVGGPPDEPLGAWLGGFMGGRGAATGSVRQLDWEDQIGEATLKLWDLAMGEVHERLTRLGLEEGAPVVVVPAGGLSLLPLGAARRAVDSGTRAFLDDYAVLVAPSAAALTAGSRTRLPHPPAPSLLAVADPTGDLAHARAEGHLIAAAFDPSTQRLLPGAVATKRAMTEGVRGRTHIHVASHGRHSWDDAQRSALTLAGGTRLTLGEITSELCLEGARLVVLSACETGLTELGAVLDEYVGLPAGFLSAGAPAVVATLWTVDDATTALLMAEFYRRHVTCDQDSGAALRGAQLWLRDLDRDATLRALEPARALAARLAQAGDPGDIRMWAGVENFCEDLLERYGPGDRPWSNPYFWAGFVHVGAAQGSHAPTKTKAAQ